MAKDLITSTNFVQQIQAGETLFDIATKRSITFYNGSDDLVGVEWNGVSDIEITIPAITDFVKDPIKFVGTVGSDGIAKDEKGSAITPSKGDLVFITADCTFEGVVCEAGDMSIFNGTEWKVVSGENQVRIIGIRNNDKEFSLTKTAQSVLSVEGKTLSLSIDLADLRSNMGVDKNASTDFNVTNGKVTVPGTYVGLSQAAGTTLDISKEETIDLPTALASDVVTITDNVLIGNDFTFDGGVLPTANTNESDLTVTVSHSMSIGKENVSDGDNGDYITSISAIKSVSLVSGSVNDNDIAYVSELSSKTGSSFVNGIHAHSVEDGETPVDFTVYGAVTAASVNNTFATGFGSEGVSGDVVSSISVGTVSIAEGSGILTGLSGNGNSVVTGITFGSVIEDSSSQWFLTGLGEEAASGDVVSSVSFGTTTLVEDNNTQLKDDAIVSVSVSNHVLSFSTASFMKPVTVSVSGTSISKKSFTKGGVTLSGFDFVSDTFTTGTISQAATTVSYKSLETGAVTLSQDSVGYHLETGDTVEYDVVYAYKSLSTEDATFTKNTPTLENTTISANVPANSVIVSLNAGTLPTLSIGNPSGTISGTVGTTLTTTSVSWLGIDSTKTATIPGEYTLVNENVTGAIEVGTSGDANLTDAVVTISANTFVTDVSVDGINVSVNA